MDIREYLSHYNKHKSLIRKISSISYSEFKYPNHKIILAYTSKNLERIINHPNNEVFFEIPLIKGDNISSSPDILILSNNDNISIIEIKTTRNRSDKVRNEINKQLSRSYDYIRESFNITPPLYGLYKITGDEDLKGYQLFLSDPFYVEKKERKILPLDLSNLPKPKLGKPLII